MYRRIRTHVYMYTPHLHACAITRVSMCSHLYLRMYTYACVSGKRPTEAFLSLLLLSFSVYAWVCTRCIRDKHAMDKEPARRRRELSGRTEGGVPARGRGNGVPKEAERVNKLKQALPITCTSARSVHIHVNRYTGGRHGYRYTGVSTDLANTNCPYARHPNSAVYIYTRL